MTVSLFGRKFKIGPFLAKNGPKLAKIAQNQCFLLIFSNWHIRFFWFFSWGLGFINVKKWPFCFFVKNSKLALFWPKTTKIWPFLTKKNSFKFWPSIDSKRFYILFLYEICLSLVLFQSVAANIFKQINPQCMNFKFLTSHWNSKISLLFSHKEPSLSMEYPFQ